MPVMRKARAVLAMALAMALVLAVSPVAVASATTGRPAPVVFPYRVSQPHVVRPAVVAGTAFDVTGSVCPTITAGDTTTIVLKMFKLPSCSQSTTVAATFTGPVGKGTGWTASVTLPTAGAYQIVALALKDGVLVGKSQPLCMIATFPYRVTRPHVANTVVHVGDAFDATGSVCPTIAPDDPSTTVALKVIRRGDCRPHEVASVPATLTGPVGKGTGYKATLSFSAPGEYALVAVVLRNGMELGRSEHTVMVAKLPYKVSKPKVQASVVATGQDFLAIGTVNPSVTASDHATLFIQVFRLRPRKARSQIATVTATFTGPVGRGTGYSATLSLPSTGSYMLVAVLYKDGIVVGKSEARPMLARPMAALHAHVRGR